MSASSPIYSQKRIKGVVTDTLQNSISFAHIALRMTSGSDIIYGYTDEKGHVF